MKSLNQNVANGSPMKNELFTEEIITHIIKEGFEVSSNNSYAEPRETNTNHFCYRKYENGNGTDIYIYICEDGIEVDQDYDCGGNLNSYFFQFNGSFELAYDEMVDKVNDIKRS